MEPTHHDFAADHPDDVRPAGLVDDDDALDLDLELEDDDAFDDELEDAS